MISPESTINEYVCRFYFIFSRPWQLACFFRLSSSGGARGAQPHQPNAMCIGLETLKCACSECFSVEVDGDYFTSWWG